MRGRRNLINMFEWICQKPCMSLRQNGYRISKVIRIINEAMQTNLITLRFLFLSFSNEFLKMTNAETHVRVLMVRYELFISHNMILYLRAYGQRFEKESRRARCPLAHK